MPPKIMIRPPRKEAPINVNDTWQNVLEPAVKQLYQLETKQNSTQKAVTADLSFTKLYDSSYRLVTQGHGKTLYRKFAECTKEYLESLPHLAAKSRKGDHAKATTNVLEPLSVMWSHFQKSLEMVKDVLLYLDRSYCDENGLARTEHVGKRLFRDLVVSQVSSQIFDQIIGEINRDRDGQIINLPVLKSAIKLLESLTEDDNENSPTWYDTKFRTALLEASVNEYQERINMLVQSGSGFEKLNRIQEFLQKESRRGEYYLPPETTNELTQTLKKSVLEPKLPDIYRDPETGAVNWVGMNLEPLTPNNSDTLKLASLIEQECGESRTLVKILADIVVFIQRQTNASPSISETEWVDKTIQLHQKCIAIANEVGPESLNFLRTHHDATIQEFGRGAEFLANYLNVFLRKSNTIAPNMVEMALEHALQIYPALRDRDTFCKIFQRLLARRLVNNSTRSKDLEITWLRRLRSKEDAATDSQQLEKMVNDYYDSEQRGTEKSASTGASDILNVTILRTDLWPVSMRAKPAFQAKLPDKLAQAQQEFEQAYKTEKQDRQLIWNYTLGNVDVRVNVGERSYFVSAPIYCMTLLALFEGDEVYKTYEIAEKTGIPMGGELERFLKSLYLVPGSNFLLKNDGKLTKEVMPEDSFRFNNKFFSSKTRIKLRSVSLKSSNGSSAESGVQTNFSELTPEEQDMLLKDRTDMAAAVIVRLMKTHKHLNHGQLTQMTIQRLRVRFAAQPQLIKSAIQYLLSKDYIERSESDSSIYIYKA